MSPHDSKPAPQKIEVDLSAILAPPQPPGPAQVTHTPECAILHQHAETAIHSHDIRLGPFGWASINFVLGSCLIAFFCTLFVSENLHFRRRAHLRDDIVYSRPAPDSTSFQGFKMELSELSPGVHLDRSPENAVNRTEATSNPSPLFSPSLPAGDGQNSSLSPNLGRFAGNGPVNNSSSVRSNSGGQDGASQATTSKSATSTGRQRSSAVRSSAARLTRRSSKQTVSTQARSLTSRQSLRRSLTGSAGKLSAGKPTSQTTGSLKSGNLQLRQRAAQTQIGATGNQISMHSMGQGSLMSQSHGAMNPMRMESGLLAQPGIGGVTGNGLGGGSRHGGQGRR